MKKINIDFESSFKEALANGINLFCGAGFSVCAKNNSGESLPVGNDFLKLLQKEFPSISNYSDLQRACTKLERTDNINFRHFIETVFDVIKIDALYYELLKLPIKNIFTTNVDNLWFKIFENCPSSNYLNNVPKNGVAYDDESAINYFPLHGSIQNKDEYIFSTTALATVFLDRGKKNSWDSLSRISSGASMLFWGWNFKDPAPLEAMLNNKVNLENNIHKWFLVHDSDEEKIDYLKTLGFNIIQGSTVDLLKYIRDFNTENGDKFYDENSCEDNVIDECKYVMPDKDKIPSYPFETYFREYTPRWSYIFNKKIYITSHYKKIEDLISGKQNIIVFGIRGCGKTTLMMQLLYGVKTKKKKHLLVDCSLEQAKLYVRNIGNNNTILFIDDCLRDPEAFSYLLQQKNVQVVGFDRDFVYESQAHRFASLSFQAIDITTITDIDAQQILNTVPKILLKNNASTKNFSKDPIIPNLLASNLKKLNFKFLKQFFLKDELAADIFLLICYVHSCGVPCSFDMIYSYLGDDEYEWKDMQNAIERSGKLIQELSEDHIIVHGLELVEDYYSCRSRFFAEQILNNIEKGSKEFRKVFYRFAINVPIYKICNYDKFRRSGYDADLAFKAFPDIYEGEDYYSICANKDNNEYCYQQAALYFEKHKQYEKAFDWIDRAKNCSSFNRFSIQSTYAQIYFSENISKDKELAKDALDLLKQCCTDDKRKYIHFISYANKVIEFVSKYDEENNVDLINTAFSFINKGLQDDNIFLSYYHKNILRKCKSDLENIKSRIL